MSQVVTGEAVRLDVRPATFASRATCGAVDLAVAWAVLITALLVSAPFSTALDRASINALLLVVVVTSTVILPVAVETLTRGRTLGKLVLGLRTVRDDGGPVRWRHCLTRGLVGFVEIWLLLGVLALLCSLLTERGKRLGDLAAGTYVIRERGPRQQPMALQVPAFLSGWARTADIARLPDGMSLAVRQFLHRAPQMHAPARDSLGRELAAAVRPYVAPPPPAGTPAEAYLMAVLAERRHRDIARLAREEQIRFRLSTTDSIDAALARVRR
ncbi:MAG: RDD family protein [Angustibacter sp.]